MAEKRQILHTEKNDSTDPPSPSLRGNASDPEVGHASLVALHRADGRTADTHRDWSGVLEAIILHTLVRLPKREEE